MEPMSAAELRVIISQLGLTQEGLANTIHVARRTMQAWCSDGVKDDPAAMLIRILFHNRKKLGELLKAAYGGNQ